jgi:hypothetical protein
VPIGIPYSHRSWIETGARSLVTAEARFRRLLALRLSYQSARDQIWNVLGRTLPIEPLVVGIEAAGATSIYQNREMYEYAFSKRVWVSLQTAVDQSMLCV